jgi:UbiD family decarboxylase
VDFERFRLRNLVDSLVAANLCEVYDEPIELVDVARVLDGNSRAVWFRNILPEGAQLVGNVMGGRDRLAHALGTSEEKLPEVLRQRLDKPIAPVEVASKDAPVHQVIEMGADADLTRFPIHLQHGLDGAPYISASLDYAIDPSTGWTNVGCRRMMPRGRREAGVDLNAPSDLRAIYQGAVARGEPLPVAYVVGAHTADFLASVAATPPMNELDVIGAVRGAAVPVVKCVTSDIRVPADAEVVIEGYLDPRGLCEPEGPYGEYIGYYGVVKLNPVFHVTAITRRRDALFQTATIGGKTLARTDAAQLCAAKTEAAVWSALQTAVREPRHVHCTPSCGGMYNVRISLRQRVPGEARNAIASVFGSTADVKHVFVVDEDVDVFSDGQMDWALATRFQADRDLVVGSGFRAVPLDPSLEGARKGGKAGFDLTKPFGRANGIEFEVPLPPVYAERPRQELAEALASAPRTFLELMELRGSRDGRDVIRELEELYSNDTLSRDKDGKYQIRRKAT